MSADFNFGFDNQVELLSALTADAICQLRGPILARRVAHAAKAFADANIPMEFHGMFHSFILILLEDTKAFKVKSMLRIHYY